MVIVIYAWHGKSAEEKFDDTVDEVNWRHGEGWKHGDQIKQKHRTQNVCNLGSKDIQGKIAEKCGWCQSLNYHLKVEGSQSKVFAGGERVASSSAGCLENARGWFCPGGLANLLPGSATCRSPSFGCRRVLNQARGDPARYHGSKMKS